jgi:outer membrane protein TolC
VARLKSKALSLSPQIKKNQAESRALKAKLKQAKASIYPVLNLRAERQWGDFTRTKSSPEDRIFLELNSSFGAGFKLVPD